MSVEKKYIRDYFLFVSVVRLCKEETLSIKIISLFSKLLDIPNTQNKP